MKRFAGAVVAVGILAGCTMPERGETGETLAPVISETTVAPYPDYATTIPGIEVTTSTPSSIAPETTTIIPLNIFNPDCVHPVVDGDNLSSIAKTTPFSVDQLKQENGLASANHIEIGQLLDICIDSAGGINDITGEARVAPTTTVETTTTLETTTTTLPETTTLPTTVPPPPATEPATTVPPPPPELPTGVEAQQTKLNELEAPLGMPLLDVDGDSGKHTEQGLCAARVALGLPISRADMEPGSEEEKLLMSTSALPLPNAPSVGAPKWGVVDQKCQVGFFGEGDSVLSFLFPVSTGMPGVETRNDTLQAHRFDPALDNGGWHDSIDYPAAPDNPLNGNMYEPVYINEKEAIHGANNVPLEPASHGCVRLHVGDQDILVNWLGIRNILEQTFQLNKYVNFVVTTQGNYYDT